MSSLISRPVNTAAGPQPSVPWLRVSAFLIALLVGLPVAVVVLNVFVPRGETWRHLASTVLPEYIANTLILAILVGIGVIIVGAGCAWLTTVCRFPMARFFQWALLLPLATPAYVMAYAYTDFLQFAGPLQGALRAATGWRAGDYWFPDVRSLGGAAFVLASVLYPYVYLARTAFLEQSSATLESARMLGHGPWRSFFRIALPLARPGIAAGTALCLMETLADYGTVAYFGVNTFSTGIFRAWFSLGDPVAAAQLGALLLAGIVAVIALERMARGSAAFHASGGRRRGTTYSLRGAKACGAWLACALPLALGFLLPAALLVRLALQEERITLTARFARLAWNSFTLAALAALIAVACALIVGYAARMRPGFVARVASRIAGAGYAIPGVVVAVGVMGPLTRIDQWLGAGKLLLSGTIIALLYAYLVRFLAVALQSVEAGLARIRRSMDDAARSLGAGLAATLVRVHAPLLGRSLIAAALLVFVDVMKELPATLALRPFDFDTLAVQTFNLAKDERLAEASIPALAIVAVGLIPVYLLARRLARED